VLEAAKQSKIVMSRRYRFVIGLLCGVSIGSVVLALFSGSLVSEWVGTLVLSVMTYGGFALILFGYFYKRNGSKDFVSDFTLSMGIGLILVWFVAAGNGSISNNGILY
jgi:peptidoglycan/LPS O-acetylase OafA/YrhL